jgi:hypothetical protein
MQDIATALLSAEWQLSARDRWISLAEFALGTFLVIGHNIFHIVPNEVPFLFVLFWVSALLRGGPWKAVGLKRPSSWPKTLLLAVVAAAVLQLGSEFVIEPLASHFLRSPENVSSVLNIPVHDWKVGLRSLVIVWIFCGIRRGNRLSRLSAHACRGPRQPVEDRLRRGDAVCRRALRFWTLLQRPSWRYGFHLLRSGARKCLPSLRPQFMGPDLGAWNLRYICCRGDLYGMGDREGNLV